MSRTASTEPQCLYKGALYPFNTKAYNFEALLFALQNHILFPMKNLKARFQASGAVIGTDVLF